MKRINWKRVWALFDEWCDWMEFRHTGNDWTYMKDKVRSLVNAELRGTRKETKRRKA